MRREKNRDRLFFGIPCIWIRDKYILFSPYAHKFAVCRENRLSNNKLFYTLEKEGFFGSPSTENIDSKTIRLTLITTTDCNLHCSYCYIDAGNVNSKYMSFEIAQNAIKGMLKLRPNAKNIQISFFGGEPTMNMDIIEKVVRFVEAQAIDHSFHITTNGVFSDDKLQFLTEHGFDFTISLDGRPIVNDQCRLTTKNVSVSGVVERTIKSVIDNKSKFNVRVTITNKNVKYIPDTIDYLSSIGVKFVHLEVVSKDGRGKSEVISEPSIRLYVKYFKKGLEHAADNGTYIINSSLMNFLTPATYFCCSVRGEMMVVTPSGKLSLCYETQGEKFKNNKFIIGRVLKDGIKLNRVKMEHMNSIDVDTIKSCENCFAKYICSSGCPKRNMDHTGSFFNVDSKTCERRKKIIREGIITYFQNNEVAENKSDYWDSII